MSYSNKDKALSEAVKIYERLELGKLIVRPYDGRILDLLQAYIEGLKTDVRINVLIKDSHMGLTLIYG